MNIPAFLPIPDTVIDPEDDGLPMSDNTLQYDYMVMTKADLIFSIHLAAFPRCGVRGNRFSPRLAYYYLRADGRLEDSEDRLGS